MSVNVSDPAGWMSAGANKALPGLSTRMTHRVVSGIVQAYSVMLTLALGLVTGCLAVGVMAGMSLFILLFISLLIASAWQAAYPKLQTAFLKHARDSFAAFWTTINDSVLDYLESCMIALNGKARLYQGSGKVVFELDEHVSDQFLFHPLHMGLPSPLPRDILVSWTS